MKKKGLLLFLILMMCIGPVHAANFPDFSFFGGIQGDLTMKAGVYYYQEICFITGEPVVFQGTVSVPDIKDRDKKNYKVAIKYSLNNAQKKAILERTVSYDIKNEYNEVAKQNITHVSIPVGGIKEHIQIDGKDYNLTSFQFSNANISERKPAIDFNSGNIFYKKVYHIDGDENTAKERLILIGESEVDLSFSNKYSSIDTTIVKLSLSHENVEDNKVIWDGNAQHRFSNRRSSSFNYVNNEVQNISFHGGLLQSENTENFLHYSYDLPKLKTEEKKAESTGTAAGTSKTEAKKDEAPQPLNKKRNRGEGDLNTYRFEDSKRLISPKFVDVKDHWAANSIFKLSSLEAFVPNQFFYPDNYITREQFAKAIINTISYLPAETQEQMKKEIIKLKRPGAKPPVFSDIKRDSPYYIYIAKADELGLMKGQGSGQFLPTRPLSRAEAISVMIRALGIQEVAPSLPYDTHYTDDRNIPAWAKDSIYMASKIHIVNGYPDGSVRPLSLMTRAEAAVMLDALVEHLRNDITIDYREKLLNR